jgi:hypothetical protein
MATMAPQSSMFADEKKDIEHAETAVHCESGGPKLDYSGAHKKTDDKEIKLVKKLDRWIMPTLWVMYWLNFLVGEI